MTAEIEELGQSLAPLIRPGSPVERARRPEVRALLREAFLATQEDRSIDELSRLVARLRDLRRTYLGDERERLAVRVSRLQRFGALDDDLAQCGAFEPLMEQSATRLASSIQARIERTLATLSDDPGVDETHEGRTMRYSSESTELVTKKVS